MVKYARPLQLERGKTLTRSAGPMRSPQAMFARDASGGAALPFDAAPTVNWAAAATELELHEPGELNVLGRPTGGPKLQDDQGTVDDTAFAVEAGIWKITMFPTVTHSGTGTLPADVRMAITNINGSTVFAESPDYTVNDGGRLTPKWIVLLNLTSRQNLKPRAAQTGGDPGVLSVEEDTPVLYLEKVGNVGED